MVCTSSVINTQVITEQIDTQLSILLPAFLYNCIKIAQLLCFKSNYTYKSFTTPRSDKRSSASATTIHRCWSVEVFWGRFDFRPTFAWHHSRVRRLCYITVHTLRLGTSHETRKGPISARLRGKQIRGRKQHDKGSSAPDDTL